MATQAGQGAARRHALAAQALNGWTNADLAKASSTDPATIRDFLDGSRWPKPPTLAKLDEAFGWTPGTLAAIGEELLDAPESESVGADSEDGDTLLFRRPEGLSDMEWAAMQRAMRGGWEWEIRKAARER